MRGKTCVWLNWFFTTVVSAAYGALSLYTFIEMTRLKKKGYERTDGMANRWGLFAATLLSFACVAFYVIFTLLFLLRKSFHSKAATGYGMVLASAGHTTLILLLSALVLHAAKPRAQFWKTKGWFDNNAYYAFYGTYIVGYILAFIYALNTLIMLFFKPALDYEAPAPAPVHKVTTSHEYHHHDVEAAKPVELAKVEHAEDVPQVEAAHDQDVKAKSGFFKGAWGK